MNATSTRPIHTTTPRKANVTDIDTDVYDESLESGVETDISTHPTVKSGTETADQTEVGAADLCSQEVSTAGSEIYDS